MKRASRNFLISTIVDAANGALANEIGRPVSRRETSAMIIGPDKFCAIERDRLNRPITLARTNENSWERMKIHKSAMQRLGSDEHSWPKRPVLPAIPMIIGASD
jgi:hypothetical protein